MKKFLSLVLALVMTMSLVTVSAGAKDFTDSSKINYAEAVDVLSEAKVKDNQQNPARDDGYEFRLFSEEDVESQAFHQKLWTQDHNRGDECRRCERN